MQWMVEVVREIMKRPRKLALLMRVPDPSLSEVLAEVVLMVGMVIIPLAW